MGNYADFWDGMQAEDRYSKITDERRASVKASLESIQRFGSFVTAGETQPERDLRLDLVDKEVRRVSEMLAEEHDVAVEPVYAFAKEKLAAETAVTDPETIDVEKGIGEETDEGGEARFADALTDVNALNGVLEEDGLDKPVRHKKEQVDLNSDTQKDSSVRHSYDDFAPNDEYGIDAPVEAFIQYLQTRLAPNEPVPPGVFDDFMAEYEATPEQFEGSFGPDRYSSKASAVAKTADRFPSDPLEESPYVGTWNNTLDGLDQLLLETDDPEHRAILESAREQITQMGQR